MKFAKGKHHQDALVERSHATTIDSGEFRAILLAAGGLAVFLYFIKLVLLPFILAGIVGYVCTPLLDWLAKHSRWPRAVFAVALFLLLMTIAGVMVSFAAERVLDQARSMATDMQAMLERFIGDAIGTKPLVLFGHEMSAQRIAQTALERIGQWLGQADYLLLFAGLGIGAIMGVFMTAVLLFYFLLSGRRVAQGILWLAPPHRRGLVQRIWRRLDPVLLRYFLGMIAVMAYTTTAAYVGLGLILGIKHAVFLAFLTGIVEVIPVVGPATAAVLAGLVALQSATGIMSIVAYAAYATALRLSIDQLFGPIVLGRAAHVHPVLIIFCFLSGGIVYGIPGVILAVPVALLVRSTLEALYEA
jgi:predicted PurR-regulated permease PerM